MIVTRNTIFVIFLVVIGILLAGLAISTIHLYPVFKRRIPSDSARLKDMLAKARNRSLTASDFTTNLQLPTLSPSAKRSAGWQKDNTQLAEENQQQQQTEKGLQFPQQFTPVPPVKYGKAPPPLPPSGSESELEAAYEANDYTCDPKWWERNRDTIGADVPRARCWKEVHAGESFEDESTLVRDPAFRYPCNANFDFPIMDRPVPKRSVFRQMSPSHVLMMHNFTAGSNFCNLGYEIDNSFVQFNFMPHPAKANRGDGCCVQMDAVEASSGLLIPLDSHYHVMMWDHDLVVAFDLDARRRRAQSMMFAPISNSSANRANYAADSLGLKVLDCFWSRVAEEKALTMPRDQAQYQPIVITKERQQQLEQKGGTGADDGRRNILFRNQQEFDSIFGDAQRTPNVDMLPLAEVGPGRTLAHFMMVELTSHPPLGIQMLLSQIAHLYTSGTLTAHRNLTVIMSDPMHSTHGAGRNFEGLLRMLPVPIIIVRRSNNHPANRLRNFYVPRMTFAPRGTIDVGDECYLQAIPDFFVPNLVARFRFALRNGRLTPDSTKNRRKGNRSTFVDERSSGQQETATTTTTTTTATVQPTNAPGDNSDGGGFKAVDGVEPKCGTSQTPPCKTKPPAPPPFKRNTNIRGKYPTPYAYPEEYEKIGSDKNGGFLLRRPIPPELERPWWPRDLRASNRPDAPLIDDLLRNPPEGLVLLKSGTSATSASRGVYPPSPHFDEVITRNGYVWLSDILPIEIRTYLINHARRIICNWGGSATAVQGLFSGNVPAAKTTKNPFNDWSQENPRNRTLDVIMFFPPEYPKREHTWWLDIPLKHHHRRFNITRANNKTEYNVPATLLRTKVQKGVLSELLPPGIDTFSECAFSSPHTWTRVLHAPSLGVLSDEHIVISDKEKNLEALGGWCRDRIVDKSDTELARRRRWAQYKYKFRPEEFL